MESPLTYVEVYLEADGHKQLHSRIADGATFPDVLEELQGKRFDLFVMCNRCIVGTATYDYTGATLVTVREDGAGIGFLEGWLRA